MYRKPIQWPNQVDCIISYLNGNTLNGALFAKIKSKQAQTGPVNLTEPGSFASRTAKPNSKMPRFAAQKGFIHKQPTEETGELISNPPPGRWETPDIHGKKLRCSNCGER